MPVYQHMKTGNQWMLLKIRAVLIYEASHQQTFLIPELLNS